MISGDVTSGSIYVLDRNSGVRYWIDFEDDHYGEYSQNGFERLICECNLLSLVDRPALLGRTNGRHAAVFDILRYVEKAGKLGGTM